jgi:hypothetical protein
MMTEEDHLNILVEKSPEFRRLLEEFDLVLDFTRKPPVRNRRSAATHRNTTWE